MLMPWVTESQSNGSIQDDWWTEASDQLNRQTGRQTGMKACGGRAPWDSFGSADRSCWKPHRLWWNSLTSQRGHWVFKSWCCSTICWSDEANASRCINMFCCFSGEVVTCSVVLHLHRSVKPGRFCTDQHLNNTWAQREERQPAAPPQDDRISSDAPPVSSVYLLSCK